MNNGDRELLGRIDERQATIKEDIDEIKDAINLLSTGHYKQQIAIEKMLIGFSNHLTSHAKKEKLLIGLLGTSVGATVAVVVAIAIRLLF